MSYDPQNEIALIFYQILSTVNRFCKEMSVDQSGEVVCGSWGLKGQHYCICYKYLCRPVQAGHCSVP